MTSGLSRSAPSCTTGAYIFSLSVGPAVRWIDHQIAYLAFPAVSSAASTIMAHTHASYSETRTYGAAQSSSQMCTTFVIYHSHRNNRFLCTPYSV